MTQLIVHKLNICVLFYDVAIAIYVLSFKQEFYCQICQQIFEWELRKVNNNEFYRATTSSCNII